MNIDVYAKVCKYLDWVECSAFCGKEMFHHVIIQNYLTSWSELYKRVQYAKKKNEKLTVFLHEQFALFKLQNNRRQEVLFFLKSSAQGLYSSQNSFKYVACTENDQSALGWWVVSLIDDRLCIQTGYLKDMLFELCVRRNEEFVLNCHIAIPCKFTISHFLREEYETHGIFLDKKFKPIRKIVSASFCSSNA